jgi:hypothetical protein
MNNRNAQQRLQDALGRVPREALPQRDLWPGIAHAIHAPTPRTWQRHTALAASVLLVSALSLYFGATQPAPQVPNSLIEEFLASLQDEHEISKQTLLVRYQGQQAYYPEWEMNMEQLEQAENVIFQALRDDPGNLELIGILRDVQGKQLDLIDKVFDPRRGSI